MTNRTIATVAAAYLGAAAWLLAFVPTLIVALIGDGDMRTDYLIIALLCWIVGRLMETTEGGRND